MMANILMCNTATTAMTTTAYAITVTINNNKLHNIILDNYKFLSLFFSQFRRIVPHVGNELFFIDLQRLRNSA